MAARKPEEIIFDEPYPAAKVGTTGYELQVPIVQRNGTGYTCQVRVWNGDPKLTQDDVRITDDAAVADFLGKVKTKLPRALRTGAQHKAWRRACDDIANHLPQAIQAEADKRNAAQPAAPSQATRMVSLAQTAELSYTSDRDAFATFDVGSHRETWPIGSRHFRDWLADRYHEATGATAGSQAIQDAINVLSGQARRTGVQRDVWVRLAEHNACLYLDLADADWRAVEISTDGWRVVTDAPVRFRRTRGMQPLPEPAADGKVELLRRFVCPTSSDDDDEDWRLRLAWLIGACMPYGPYVVLFLNGGQGSVKSFAQRLLRRVIDPNIADLRSAPREEVDLLIAANNGWIVAYDNLSILPDWLSDAFCRLASGAGLGKRELFTNAEETLIAVARPIMFNGIGDLALRGDLVDRTIAQVQGELAKEHRLPERALLAAFRADHPKILGGLCDILVGVLRHRDLVVIDELPRMADFALWATAAEPTLQWEAGSLVKLFNANQARAQHVVVEGSLLGTHLVAWFHARSGLDKAWSGTASALLLELNTRLSEDELKSVQRPRSGWPKDSTRMSSMLRRLAPTVRVTDQISIVFDEKSRPRKFTIGHIEEPPDLEQSRNSASAASAASGNPDLSSKSPDASDVASDASVGPSVGPATANLSSNGAETGASVATDASDAGLQACSKEGGSAENAAAEISEPSKPGRNRAKPGQKSARTAFRVEM